MWKTEGTESPAPTLLLNSRNPSLWLQGHARGFEDLNSSRKLSRSKPLRRLVHRNGCHTVVVSYGVQNYCNFGLQRSQCVISTSSYIQTNGCTVCSEKYTKTAKQSYDFFPLSCQKRSSTFLYSREYELLFGYKHHHTLPVTVGLTLPRPAFGANYAVSGRKEFHEEGT